MSNGFFFFQRKLKDSRCLELNIFNKHRLYTFFFCDIDNNSWGGENY